MSNDVTLFHQLMVLFVFILTYYGIVNSKFDKTISAVMGAVVAGVFVSIFGIIETEQELIPFADLQIIGLIFGTLILVDVSQEAGVFHFLSVKILKMSKGDPKRLLRYFGVLTLVLSALVNNISAMMIVGSLTIIACERLELNPKPYIVVELSMTTVGGIVTLISSVPNIIVASIFEIDFVTFFLIGAPWSIILMVANFAVFEYIYKDEFKIKTDPKDLEARVNEFDEWSAVKDRNLFYQSIIILSATIVAFVFSAQLGLSLSIIAITGGITIVFVSGKNLDSVMSKLDWGLIAFFLGLFALIATLEIVDILHIIAESLAAILPKNGVGASLILMWFVAIVSGIVDNIVVAAAFGPILLEVTKTVPALGASKDLIAWATIFGANMGGGFTPIGAPSGVVGLALLKKKTGVSMGWIEFFRTQGIATIIRLVLTMIYLWILSFIL